MSVLLKILRYNDILAPSLSLIVNLVLLYLIITVKKLELKHIKFVLLPNCFIDILLSLVTFMISPQVFNVKFTAYIITESFLSFYGLKGANIMLWIYASIVLASMNAICIPFYLKYLCICRNITIKLKNLILPYTILFLSFILIFISLIWCFPINEQMNSELRAPTLTHFWIDEYPNGPLFVAANINSLSFIIPYSIVIATCVCSYIMVLFFSIKISKYLKLHVNKFTGSKILSNQLHRTLIIQAIGPLLIANIPIFFLVGMIFLKIENISVSLCFSFFVGWIPIVNPLAAILIITPFKTKLFGVFKNIKNKINPYISTS